jgi:hypothetical protein
MGFHMTGWDHEFAVPFINEGLFHVTDPGPLRAPILDFSMRRDEKLDLILETRTAPAAKSTAPEHPSGTVRINTDCASLENIGGVKVKLTGVLPNPNQVISWWINLKTADWWGFRDPTPWLG